MSTHGGGASDRTRSTPSGSGGGANPHGFVVQPDGSLTHTAGSTRISSAARATLSDFFGGRAFSDEEVRAMVGAPRDAHVAVDTRASHNGQQVVFRMTGPTIEYDVYHSHSGASYHVTRPAYGGDNVGAADRYLMRNADGQIVMGNNTFRVDAGVQGIGIGLRVFAREAATLSGLGVARIIADMAGWRNSSDQGYRIWPLMGYNTQPGSLANMYDLLMSDRGVSRGLKQAVRSLGRDRLTILDLYALGPEARTWWRENGMSLSGFFDLTPGSRSMTTLRAYAASHGVTV